MKKQYKVIVEKHPDGYVAYPIGVRGIIVGQGDTYEEALADVKLAKKFHIESFGHKESPLPPTGPPVPPLAKESE